MEQVTSTTEKLNKEEKNLLLKRMLGVWVFGIFMFCLLTYFFFFFSDTTDFNESSLLLLFPLFFYAVLAFIIFSHTRNAFQKTKTVYSGVITDKKNKAHQGSKNSSVRQSYQICLGNKEFDVDQAIYAKLKVGNHAKLHCLHKTTAFKVDVVNVDDGNIFHTVEANLANHKRSKPSYSLLDLMPFSSADSAIIRGKLFSTIVFRVVVGFGILAVIYFIAFIFLIMNIDTEEILLIRTLNFVLLGLLAMFYFFINVKTWNLFRDLLDAQKYKLSDEIIDKVSSNTKKPGPNSVIVTNNYTPNQMMFFYLQTTSFWLPVSAIEFNTAYTGEFVDISVAKNSKVVLRVDLTEK